MKQPANQAAFRRYFKPRFIIFTALVCFALSTALYRSPVSAQSSSILPSLMTITEKNATQVQVLAGLGWGLVSSAIWSPDGQTLAVASVSGVRLYQTKNYTNAPRLLSDSNAAEAVAFSSDGSLLAIGTTTTLQIWDAHLWRLRETWDKLAPGVVGIGFRADNAGVVAIVEDGRLIQWDLKTGSRQTLPNPSAASSQITQFVYGEAFNADASRVVFSAEDGHLWLWNVADSQQTDMGAFPPTGNLTISPDGKYLAVGNTGDDAHLKLYAITASNALSASIADISDAGSAIAFSSDGHWLVAAGKKNARLYDVRTTIPTLVEQPLAIEEDKPQMVTFSPDGESLAVAEPGQPVRLYDTHSGVAQTALGGYSGEVNALAFSPDGTTLASAEHNAVRLWDPSNGTTRGLLTGDTDTVWDVAYNSDGSLLASASDSGTIRLWKADGSDISYTPEAPNRFHVWTVAFSPYSVPSYQSEILTTTYSTGLIDVWDTHLNRLGGFALSSYTQQARSVAFSPAQNGIPAQIAFGNFDASIELKLLDGSGDVMLHQSSGWVNALAFSSDGKWLAAANDDGSVTIWDIVEVWKAQPAQQPPRTTLVFPDAAKLPHATSVTFNADNTLVAAGYHDGNVRLWSVKTGAMLAMLTGLAVCDYPIHLAFSPDGKLLAIGSGDGTIRLWGVPQIP